MSFKNALDRRRFLASLGVGGALPFLETAMGRNRLHAAPNNQLKRLVIVAQPHMSLGYHRIPDYAQGAYGRGNPALLQTDQALGLRVGSFGNQPGLLGGFYEQGALARSARLQQEMMVVNGLACTYDRAQGHQSDANGSWNAGAQSGKLNARARYPLSASLHEVRVTMDQVIAKKIHTSGERAMLMGDGGWGGGGASTDESVDQAGAIQTLSGSPRDLFNGPIFDAGRKIKAAQDKAGAQPTTPADPLAALATDDFALRRGLEFSQNERKLLLTGTNLSGADRVTLEQYYDLLGNSLGHLRKSQDEMKGGTPGASVSDKCANPTVGNGDITGFMNLVGAAFLCDLSRVALVSVGRYIDHNSEWHAGAGGDPAKVGIYNNSALQAAQVAEFLLGLTDPETGRDMLENTLVLQITNCSMALKGEEKDPSHSYGDYSYFSIGGSAALNTGKMYDAMGVSGGKRRNLGGPLPTVNQYLQTVASGFGLTAADWSPAGGKGFGPWLSSVWRGHRLRTSDADKTGPIPGLLKA